MTKPRLKLRGHHISTFALEYFGSRATQPIFYDSLIHRNDENSYFKKIDKLNIIQSNLDGISSAPKDVVTREYGKGMKQVVDTVYFLLRTQPDLDVEVVSGLDSICLANCPRLNVYCARTDGDEDEDSKTLEMLGLESGKVYKAREIVQRVIDFSRRTGLKCPREQIWGELNQLPTLPSSSYFSEKYKETS